MSSALITGGAGFVGLNLARRLLSEGLDVTLIDNFSRGAQDNELRSVVSLPRATMHDRDLLSAGPYSGMGDGFDYIFHFAALIGVRNVLNRPYEVLQSNCAMTVSALAFAAKQRQLKRFVFASTSEVYAGTLNYFGMTIPTPESTPLTITGLENPRTTYMLSKIYGEALCRHAGCPFSIVRLHNAYGPRMGMDHVIPELLKKAHTAPSGGELEVFSVSHRRTFCFIDDVVTQIAAIAGSDKCAGETLNVGNQEPEVSIQQVAEIVCDTVGKKLRIAPRPETPGSPARRCPDMQRTLALTGCRGQVDLPEGVRRTYDWYRANVFQAQAQ